MLSPTVYLALFTTGTNLFARAAFNEGTKIAWWSRALRGGTVRDLQVHWDYANGFWAALFSGRRFNLVALGSIAVTFMVVDQPLIQRASRAVSVQRTVPVNVTASVAPEIPWGFTGYQEGPDYYDQVMTQVMMSAFSNYSRQTQIVPGFSGCSDSCTGFVAAGGLAARCTTTRAPIQYFVLKSNAQMGEAFSPFSVDFVFLPDGADAPSHIIMNIAYTTQQRHQFLLCHPDRADLLLGPCYPAIPGPDQTECSHHRRRPKQWNDAVPAAAGTTGERPPVGLWAASILQPETSSPLTRPTHSATKQVSS